MAASKRPKERPTSAAAAGSRSAAGRLEEGREFRLVVTDSGLGGLAVCAGLERALGTGDEAGQPEGPASSASRSVRLIYVNAWPDEAFGYNDLPNADERALLFDRALEAMERLQPDLILIACNTLSVLFGLTAFSRRAVIPARGILEAGTDLFVEALSADADATLVLFGTRTTIESGAHLERLMERGVAAGRVSAVACHGLAAAIDADPGGAEVRRMLAACAAEACKGAARGDAGQTVAPLTGAGGGGTWYAGLACTHYGYVKNAFRAALEKCSGRRVSVLDPNERLVSLIAAELNGALSYNDRSGAETEKLPEKRATAPRSIITVEMISKVALDDRKRRAVAARLEPASGLTAGALLNYKRQADLF